MGEDRRPRVPESLQEPFRSALVAAAEAWIEREGLISIVLFGSVARRQAGPMSDIDVLLVAGYRTSSGTFKLREGDYRILYEALRHERFIVVHQNSRACPCPTSSARWGGPCFRKPATN
jgi:predicted nucleotidyltransferase